MSCCQLRCHLCQQGPVCLPPRAQRLHRPDRHPHKRVRNNPSNALHFQSWQLLISLPSKLHRSQPWLLICRVIAPTSTTSMASASTDQGAPSGIHTPGGAAGVAIGSAAGGIVLILFIISSLSKFFQSLLFDCLFSARIGVYIFRVVVDQAISTSP